MTTLLKARIFILFFLFAYGSASVLDIINNGLEGLFLGRRGGGGDEGNADNVHNFKPRGEEGSSSSSSIFYDDDNNNNAELGNPDFPSSPVFDGGEDNDNDNGNDEDENKDKDSNGAEFAIDGAVAAGGSGDKKEKPDFMTRYLGDWKLHNLNAGVSSMHFQLLPNNKVIMSDAGNLGPSNIQLTPVGNCRPLPGRPNEVDCWAHAVEYDSDTAQVRTLKVLTDPWCSSGGVSPDGNLISTGGYKDGGSAVRILGQCPDCDWQENARGLGSPRWYATQEKLEDGSFILFGGRDQFNYEFVQNSLNFPIRKVDFPFLKETRDKVENNLYPFAHLLPDGTVFLLANSRSVILDPKANRILREFPILPGGSRNYPASGMSALLPLRIGAAMNPQVLVCGGAKPEAFARAEKGDFLPALQDCGRIEVMKPGAQWEIDVMPSRRVMGDMLLLPTGDVLILNGATHGASGWNFADGPNLTPVLYSPKKKLGERFKELQPTTIPRMYHASSGVVADGTVLVAGSNTNPNYVKENVKFPTDVRVEKFFPPYLDPKLETRRPRILENTSDKRLAYGKQFHVKFELNGGGKVKRNFKVTLLAPPFTTHGYSMNQRLLVLDPVDVSHGQVTAVAPPSGKLAPPGYYLLYLVHGGVPSRGMWIHIQ